MRDAQPSPGHVRRKGAANGALSAPVRHGVGSGPEKRVDGMPNTPWKKAIEKVLSQSDRPLSRTEIAEAIVTSGLRDDVGATPGNTVVSNISTSLKKEGDKSPFYRVGRGEYWLRRLVAAESERGASEGAEEPDSKGTGLINAFGMFWERQQVSWAKSKPALLGIEQTKAKPIDFCNQIGVYILYDNYHPIYVGRTTSDRLGIRLREHHTTSRFQGRWNRFSWFGICPIGEDGKLLDPTVPTDSDAVVASMEALLIEAMEPAQNRKRGDGFSGVEYLQVNDPELEQQLAERQILERLIRGVK